MQRISASGADTREQAPAILTSADVPVEVHTNIESARTATADAREHISLF